jgi:hypothetical protein
MVMTSKNSGYTCDMPREKYMNLCEKLELSFAGDTLLTT